MKPEIDVPIRYNKPTKFSEAPYGTMIAVISPENAYSYYIQTSKDKLHPEWHPISDLLEHAYKKRLNEDAFIEELLKKFESHV